MIKIPDLKLTVCKKIVKDLKEYRELYAEEHAAFMARKPLEIYHDEKYFVDFDKSLSECDDLYKGYKKQIIDDLCKFRHGQRICVYDSESGRMICSTFFKNPYISINDGYVYFNTDASIEKKYDPKKCIIKPYNG